MKNVEPSKPTSTDRQDNEVNRNGESFDDYLPLTAVRTAPGEYDIMSANGRRLWFMEGASLADWVCASVNGYDGALRAIASDPRTNTREAVNQIAPHGFTPEPPEWMINDKKLCGNCGLPEIHRLHTQTALGGNDRASTPDGSVPHLTDSESLSADYIAGVQAALNAANSVRFSDDNSAYSDALEAIGALLTRPGGVEEENQDLS